MSKSEDRFIQGIKDGIPIGLGYLSVSFAFGIFAVNQGLYFWQAIAISMTNLTSAGQLAGVPIITGTLPYFELILSQLVINMRYALMSISLSQKLDNKVSLLNRFFIAFFNTDEVFAVASGRSSLVGKHYMFGLGLTPYLGWTLGTTLGSIAGNILPQVVTNALGIAIYGMFIAIIIPVAKRNKAVLGATLVASLISIIFTFVPIFRSISSGFVIIISAVVASGFFAYFFPVKEATHE